MTGTRQQQSTRTRRGSDGPSVDEIAIAAALSYDDMLLDEEIADSLHVSRRTLARWKHRRHFRAAYAALVHWHRVDLIRDARDQAACDALDDLLDSGFIESE